MLPWQELFESHTVVKMTCKQPLQQLDLSLFRLTPAQMLFVWVLCTIAYISVHLSASRVQIEAGQTVESDFQFYEGGVFDEPNCYNEPSRLTHSMLIIGYGTYKRKDYWLVKNRSKTTVMYYVWSTELYLPFLCSLQLGHWLGHEWLHHDGERQEQPMWDCHSSKFSITLDIAHTAAN